MIWSFANYAHANMAVQSSSSVATGAARLCGPCGCTLRACILLSERPTVWSHSVSYPWCTPRRVWCERATVRSLEGVPCASFAATI